MKVCNRCKLDKEASEFSMNSKAPDGKAYTCRSCMRQVAMDHKNKFKNDPKHQAYVAWKNMIYRCYSDKSPSFHNYGGRGIAVCLEWKDSFESFYKDMGDPPSGFMIDRVNNNGNYTPENCKWVSKIESANNRRVSVFLEYNGVRKTKAQWAALFGLSDQLLHKRIKSGWDIERALTTPTK